jgi:hypothetical protein
VGWSPSLNFRSGIRSSYAVHGWLHSHFTGQLGFSAQDYEAAWKWGDLFLLNGKGEVLVLTRNQLQEKADIIAKERGGGLKLDYQDVGLAYPDGLRGEEIK